MSEEQTTTWPELAIALYDKLTDRNAEISYNFENFELSVPSAAGGDQPTATWKVNGKLTIRTADRDHPGQG